MSRRRFVHNSSAEPSQKYRLRNRFSHKDASSQKDTAALPSITTFSRQNNTRSISLSEDDNT